MPVKHQALLSNERGMSIIELLIATILSLLVLSAALEFYLSQHKNWLMQNEVAEVQQNARVCVDEIAETLRMAGYGLPTGHPSVEIGTDSLTVYAFNETYADIDTMKYFIFSWDTRYPYLVRHVNGEAAAFFSNDVESLKVAEISPRRFKISLTSRSERPDEGFIGGDGYRRRTVTTEDVARNLAIQ